MDKIGNYILPLFILAVILLAFIKRIKIFYEFTNGAKEGIKSAVSLLPTLVALVTAVKMLEASGAVDIFTSFFSLILSKTGFPKEAVALSLLKPISGSGSIAILSSVLEKVHPDSFAGLLSSVIFCSYDTVFYIASVYFSSVSYKNTGKVIFASLCGYFMSIILSFVFLKLEAGFLF